MNERIDAELSALNQDAPESAPPAEEKQIADTEPQADNQEDSSDELEEVVFPKKAVNAISRRDKQIAKLKSEHAQAMQELQRFRMQEVKPQEVKKEIGAPKLEDFENLQDYLDAKMDYIANDKYSSLEKKQQETFQQKQEAIWTEQRENYVAEVANKYIQEVPDFKQLLVDNVDIVDSYPPHVQKLFLEAENAPMAFYALAKDGALEILSNPNISPTQAAMIIGRAQERGIAMSAQKQVTKAPTPISGAKGTGKFSKTLDNMTADELREWRKS